VGKLFFFVIENGNNDLNEQVEHEDGLNENHYHKVNHARWGSHRSWHLKSLRLLLGFKCDCKPVFNVGDLEHRQECSPKIVEILLSVHPFSAVVQAVPHVVNTTLKWLRDIVHVTTVERPHKQVHTQHGH